MINTDKTIIVTGAAGFIGSCLVSYLNEKGFDQLILVDEFDDEEKELNLLHKKYLVRVEREDFFDWINKEKIHVDFVFHLGARTDTTEFDYAVLEKLNLVYSKQVWEYCTASQTPLVYASSAATYGNGEKGYDDHHEIVNGLQPLNPYGISKNEFDKWALAQKNAPPFWAGLKFFNVYGPNEYHKGRMASVIFHAFNQVKETGKVKLFKSHKEGFNDGEQLRDFIYVKDILNICFWLMTQQTAHELSELSSGLYNAGTGVARSFKDLVAATFAGLSLPPRIEYIDMPLDIRDKYQYFTEATMDKLKAAGYTDAFYSLEDGVMDYVKNYLSKNIFY